MNKTGTAAAFTVCVNMPGPNGEQNHPVGSEIALEVEEDEQGQFEFVLFLMFPFR